MDDDTPIVYIEKDSLKAIIIEGNSALDKKGAAKIQIGKFYHFDLKPIERNYRGRNDDFRIQSKSGKEFIIWTKDDGFPLLLYKANNLSGVWIKEQDK
ncbi:hypothetical protein NU09_2455 [Flavobacterium beibuense]|uniref:Uncharacterized protein n=1 Tax=Flavobacterium beibuense TaxID=657326 RepID=A0A444W834_9FLAO|nr:hypothetical protein NU09_2455 [Flavobacterium beibuense]